MKILELPNQFSRGRNLIIASICLLLFSFLAYVFQRDTAIGNANKGELDDRLFLFGETQGTTYSITIHGLPPDLSEAEVRSIVELELASIDRQVSNWNHSSEISLFNAFRESDWYPVSEATCKVIAAGLNVSRETQAAFDMTVKPLVELWGFGVDSSVSELPSDTQIASTLSQVGWEKIEVRADFRAIRKTNPGMQVDLAGIAQGYSVDRIADSLEQAGITMFLVEIGGEAVSRGKKQDGTPWRIGIERPDQAINAQGSIQAVIKLENLAIATSGDYRHFRLIGNQRYSHIIDSRSGHPIRHNLASVSVVTKTCTEADALSTALMVMGESDGYSWANKHNVAAMFITRHNDNYSVKVTPQFIALVDSGIELQQ
jgi:thiamine biosynthesis lipoprotein